MPLFTNFLTGREPGILDWYTGLVGLFTLAALAVHGALYLAWRTTGRVHERSLALARRRRRSSLRSGPPQQPPLRGFGPTLHQSRCPPLVAGIRRPGDRRGLGNCSGSRGGAVSSRRSSPPPLSCWGCWPRRRRVSTRSGCDRPSTSPTASLPTTPVPPATG